MVGGRGYGPSMTDASTGTSTDASTGTSTGTVRQRLAQERDRLQALQSDLGDLRADDEQGDLSELSSADQHPGEMGTETFNRERDLSTLEQVEAELAEVDAALDRLADGSYGRCLACGQPIGEERLRAVPAARFCLADQQRAEVEAAGRRVDAPDVVPVRGGEPGTTT